jgi:hypothetical protein
MIFIRMVCRTTLDRLRADVAINAGPHIHPSVHGGRDSFRGEQILWPRRNHHPAEANHPREAGAAAVQRQAATGKAAGPAGKKPKAARSVAAARARGLTARPRAVAVESRAARCSGGCPRPQIPWCSGGVSPAIRVGFTGAGDSRLSTSIGFFPMSHSVPPPRARAPIGNVSCVR